MPTLDERIEAPERIWIEEDSIPYYYQEDELPDAGSPVTEYIRADLVAAEREWLLKIIADRCPQCRGTGIKGGSGGTEDAKTILWKCDHGLQWAALASEPRT